MIIQDFFDINLHLQKSKMIADNVKVKESLGSPNTMRLCVKNDMPWREWLLVGVCQTKTMISVIHCT